MINVSQPYLPPLEELMPYFTRIWQNKIITNNGPLVQELEDQLKRITGAKNALLVSNGTTALQLAIRALDIKGKILTTPFSAVATLSSILWEHHEPCFADIDAGTLNISVSSIEEKKDEQIGCILATHVYGNSCDIARLESIASVRKIPLIFDASHAFGSRYHNRDIMTYGSISTLSLQSYKIMHSVEGGVVFTNDDEIAEKVFQMRYFGYDNHMEVEAIGINGKTSEMNAAMGLCVLSHFDEIKQSRLAQSLYYDKLLSESVPQAQKPIITPGSECNNAYYAVILPTENDVMKIQYQFEKDDIQLKRYFHPSLNTLGILKNYEAMPVSESIASRVICLPLYHTLTNQEQDHIVNSMVTALH
jgi:dTDP-4-amino-4,6-dideoxygalactose transaminase